MNEARRIATPAHGTVVQAGYQRSGRGTADRSWVSSPGANLLCTIILERSRVEVPPQIMPLLMGIAVSKTVELIIGRHAEIKWPNDVLVDGSKIAGILCEATPSTLYAGIGINCNQSDFPRFRISAISLRDLTGEFLQVSSLLERLLTQIMTIFESPPRYANWGEEVESRLFLRGEIAILDTKGERRQQQEVRIVGVVADGALRVARPDGKIENVYAGEVSVRALE